MKRIYSLDILRFIGTIFIIFHHYQQIVGMFWEKGLNFYNGTFSFGIVVEFFFILSGFFAYRYVEADDLAFSSFYISKMKRLLPLVLISSVVYEVLLYISKYTMTTPTMLYDEISVWGIVINGLGIQSGWCFKSSMIVVNNPVWYVSSLLFCYIVFFFLIYVSRRIKIPVTYLFIAMIFLGISIIEYHIELPFLNVSTGKGYRAFFFGIILAHILKEKAVGWKHFIVSCLIVLGMTYGLIEYYHYFENGIENLMTFIYYPSVIIMFLSKPMKKVFGFAFIKVLGEVAYDMYVWHLPMILLMYILISKNTDFANLISRRETMYLFCVGMFIVGIISHYGIDYPIQKLLKKKSEKG